MSLKTTTPDGAPLPRATPGSVGSGSSAGEPISPEDYRNPAITDYLGRRLPPGIVYRNGQPEASTAVEAPPPERTLTGEQAAREVADEIFEALTKKPETFWPRIERAIQLGFLMDGIDVRAVRVALPFNAGQVQDGGVSVLKAVQTDRKASCMEVDVGKLGQRLAASIVVQRAKSALEPAFRAVDANETVVLGDIAEIVSEALAVGDSVISADGNLSWVLGPARAIRSDPAAAAVAKRFQNERTGQAIRAEARADFERGAAELTAPAPLTTTVTTQTPAARMPYAPAPKK